MKPVVNEHARQHVRSDCAVADEMFALIERLYPICRSITGPGVRQTLSILQEHVPIDVHEVPTGTQVLDWQVPKEWTIRDAYIKDASSRRVIDFCRSNLHVVNYSVPVHQRMSLQDLQSHLHSLPDHPDWIPYRTSYYEENWGFCLTHRQRSQLKDQEYDVCIESTLANGSLTYGELFVPGETRDEVLLSCHICHPSLCNDNLSAVAVALQLAKYLAKARRRYSYRLLFIPGTIGAITWLSQNLSRLANIKHGMVLALLGDSGQLTYKRSRRGDADIDRAAELVLKQSGRPHHVLDFEPYGYDERQFCSPGFDLPVGRLTRSPNGAYPEYHTSADDLNLVRKDSLADSLDACLQIIEVLEQDRTYRNTEPRGEPQLGRRGLYQALGGQPQDNRNIQHAMLWVLNYSDGRHSLLDIAERSGLSVASLRHAADLLADKELLIDHESPAAAFGWWNSGDQTNGHHGDQDSIGKNGTVRGRRDASAWQRQAHRLIPGGCHTYAKGDDQYPESAPPFLVEGHGCRVRDIYGREYIEYGSGLRAVTLGHGCPAVVEAAARQMQVGDNFVRPTTLEVECAEAFLGCVTGGEMVKFTKNGSDATTAAVKLARACTGRDLVAICASHPFFSVDDWFIGTTAMDAGIPQAVKDLTVSFRYNDTDSVRKLFEAYEGQIACLVMEAATAEEPQAGFLQEVRQLCTDNGTLFVLDEIITGFRWHLQGAQHVYDVTPDLSIFGKAMANGFSLAALTGKREFMQRGGLDHPDPRVFLLSTTFGAEGHSLAAAMATMRTYQQIDVVGTLYRQGSRLRDGIMRAACDLGIDEYFKVLGRPCNLVYATLDPDKQRSQAYRTLFMHEIIQRGVIAPSLVVNYSHDDDAIDQTIEAVSGALGVYARALEDGVDEGRVGRSVKPVFRKHN